MRRHLQLIIALIAAAIPTFADHHYKVLHNFGGTTDGQLPGAPVIVGKGGILYGTTEFGGTGPTCVYGYQGCGTVYSLTPPASAGETWTETVLYSFTGGTDGGGPGAGLVIGGGGLLYGAARFGGDASCSNQGTKGCGVVFSLTPPASPGGAWTQTVLYTFTGAADGASPNAVTFDKNGVLYGTTWAGGNSSCNWMVPGCGTVYSLTPPASPGGAWSFQVLSEFSSTSGPSNPLAGLLISGGVLYGTSYDGGDLRFLGGLGTVFSLTPPKTQGGPWTQTLLHSFEGAEGDGANPSGAVVMGTDGGLYGTTQNGGSGECSATGIGGCGAVFSLSPPASSGAAWSETLLYSVNTFGRCSNGSTVYAGVTLASNGVLYGTTDCGSEKSPGGQVYSLIPPYLAGAPWAEATIHNFANSANGSSSYANVVIGKDGVLYGTTYSGGTNGVGTVFSVKP